MNFSNQELQTNDINENKTYKFLKRLLIFAVIGNLFLVFLTLTSCSNDDNIAVDDIADDPMNVVLLPEIELESGSEDVVLGIVGGAGNSGLNHSIEADAPEGMVSLTIYSVRDGVVAEYATIAEGHPDYTAGMTSYNYQLDYIFKENDVDVNLFFKAEVLDEEGNIASLDFAKASVKLPMIKETFSLQASKSGNYNNFSPYYLYIKGNTIESLSIPDANTEENDTDIAAILSFNDDSQYYLASPTDIKESALTDGLLEISKTKFKKGDIAENDLDKDFSILNTHEIENNFKALSFDEEDERINNLKVNARFYFTTEDGRIAIVQLRKTTNLGPNTLFTFDIFITQ